MQHIGASVKMDYGPESGAYDKDVIPALTHYFGYDKDIIKMLDRTNFEWEDWNKILLDELGKKRPIYYCGHSFIGGHAFVCDGMDSDGYYHINWGWGGESNDYFDITILNPNNGIGFNESNSAILGIVPNNSQDKQPSLNMIGWWFLIFQIFLILQNETLCLILFQGAYLMFCRILAKVSPYCLL